MPPVYIRCIPPALQGIETGTAAGGRSEFVHGDELVALRVVALVAGKQHPSAVWMFGSPAIPSAATREHADAVCQFLFRAETRSPDSAIRRGSQAWVWG